MGKALGVLGSSAGMGGGGTPPGDVTAPAVEFLGYSDPTADGEVSANFKLTYAPPDPLGTFVGVHAYVDAPDSVGAVLLTDTATVEADTAAGPLFAPADLGKVDYDPTNPVGIALVSFRAPQSTETWRFYLPSYSTAIENALVKSGDPGETPNVTIDVDPPPVFPDGGTGEEYAQLVTGATASVGYNPTRTRSGVTLWRILASWVYPILPGRRRQTSTFGGVDLVLEEEGSEQRETIVSQSYPIPDFTSLWRDLPASNKTYKLWIVSWDSRGRRNSIKNLVTPMVELSVSGKGGEGDEGVEATPNVSGFAAVPTYVPTDASQQLFIDFSWTEPADTRYGGVIIRAYKGLFPPGADSDYFILSGLMVGLSTFRFTWPGAVDPAGEHWVFYAACVNKQNQPNNPDRVGHFLAAGLNPSPKVALDLVPTPLADPGIEYAPNVTGFTAVPTYVREGNTQLKLYVDFSWTEPSDASFGGAKIRAFRGSPPGTAAGYFDFGTIMRGSGSGTYRFTWPGIPETDETDWTFYAVSFDRLNHPNNPALLGNYKSGAPNASPKATPTIPAPALGAAGVERTSNVTGFSVTTTFKVNGQGQQSVIVEATYTKPADLSWGGVDIGYDTGNTGIPSWNWYAFIGVDSKNEGGSVTLRAEFATFPASAQTWRFWALSRDVNGQGNTFYPDDNSKTPHQDVTIGAPALGGSGAEYTSNVTGFALSSETYRTDSDGGATLVWILTFTPPSDPTWGGVNLVLDDGTNRELLGDFYRSPAKVTLPVPGSNVTWNLYAQSFDVNGRTNTIQGGVTPGIGMSITGATSRLDMSKVKSLTYQGSEFEVLSGAFTIKNLSCDKINAGTLSVGGGGGKAGKIAVFDGSGTAVGHIGYDGSTVTWLKTLGIGGSGFSTAKFKADASGNVTITDGALSVTSGSLVFAINPTDGLKISYSGHKIFQYIVGASIPYLAGYNLSGVETLQIFPAGGGGDGSVLTINSAGGGGASILGGGGAGGAGYVGVGDSGGSTIVSIDGGIGSGSVFAGTYNATVGYKIGGVLQPKVKGGASQLVAGVLAVVTGLTAVTGFVAIPVTGGAPTEYLGTNTASGGTVTVYSSNGASTSFFYWIATGT